MKTKFTCLAIIVGALGLLPTARSQSAMSSGQVNVTFDHPERFTDARTRLGAPTDEHVLDSLRDYIVQTASPRLASGTTLTITFTDLDLAGSFVEPRPTRQFRSTFPPVAKFNWVLTDASGATVRQGSEVLSDTIATQANLSRESLHFEKDMLKTWIRRTLK